MRHIRRDQFIWAVVQFIGMALPCMLTLEFIRNATVEGNRVAAMTAEGMADRTPDYRFLFWTLTLFCGFIILAPGQVSVNDQIARRWTDILWTTTKWARRFAGPKVKYLYYGILVVFCLWGLVALSLFDPLQILKISTVLQNVALGFSSLHALYITRGADAARAAAEPVHAARRRRVRRVFPGHQRDCVRVPVRVALIR